MPEARGSSHEIVFTQYTTNPRPLPPAELEATAFQLTGRHYPSFYQPRRSLEPSPPIGRTRRSNLHHRILLPCRRNAKTPVTFCKPATIGCVKWHGHLARDKKEDCNHAGLLPDQRSSKPAACRSGYRIWRPGRSTRCNSGSALSLPAVRRSSCRIKLQRR